MRVIVETPSGTIAGLTADQVLTSSLFDLRDTRDLKTVQKIERYSELLGNSQRTAVEQKEFEFLHQDLIHSLPLGNSETERRMAAVIRTFMEQHPQGVGGQTPGGMSSDFNSEVKRRVRDLLGKDKERS